MKNEHDEHVNEVASEIQDRAKADADLVDSTYEDLDARIKREKAATSDAAVLTDLGRIDEVRTTLARGYDTYRASVDQALKRLNGYVGGSADAVVQKTARAVADAYDLKLNAGGLKQPKAPKA